MENKFIPMVTISVSDYDQLREIAKSVNNPEVYLIMHISYSGYAKYVTSNKDQFFNDLSEELNAKNRLIEKLKTELGFKVDFKKLNFKERFKLLIQI